MRAAAAHAEGLAASLALLPPRTRWQVIGEALDIADMLRLEVPGAVVSKNRALRFSGERVFRTAESRAYQETASWQARAAMRGREPLAGRLAAVLVVRVPDLRRGLDLDNASKAPLDGFRGIVYRDDRQIDVLVVRRIVAPGQPATLLAAVEEIG